MFDFRPYLVLVVDVFFQLYHRIHHSVAGHRISFVFTDLFVGKEKLLQRFGQLFLDLCRRRTGIDPDNNALSDSESRKFLLGHFQQCVNAHKDEQGNQKKCNAPVPHGGFDYAVLVFHRLQNF